MAHRYIDTPVLPKARVVYHHSNDQTHLCAIVINEHASMLYQQAVHELTQRKLRLHSRNTLQPVYVHFDSTRSMISVANLPMRRSRASLTCVTIPARHSRSVWTAWAVTACQWNSSGVVSSPVSPVRAWIAQGLLDVR
jgi:hypothetical protein